MNKSLIIESKAISQHYFDQKIYKIMNQNDQIAYLSINQMYTRKYKFE